VTSELLILNVVIGAIGYHCYGYLFVPKVHNENPDQFGGTHSIMALIPAKLTQADRPIALSEHTFNPEFPESAFVTARLAEISSAVPIAISPGLCQVEAT